MISREEVLRFSDGLPLSKHDCPFNEDFDTTVLRHSDSGKWFGLLFKAPARKVGIDADGETDIVNLKCDPALSFGLISQYKGIVPAYHMNKYHWISVVLSGDVPVSVLFELIGISYELTAVKEKRKKNG